MKTWDTLTTVQRRILLFGLLITLGALSSGSSAAPGVSTSGAVASGAVASGAVASGVSTLGVSISPEPPPDPRQTYTVDGPEWLRAVGRLEVPGSRYKDGRRSHHREDCSATLIARRADTAADTLITAWHCLEFYNDLSKPITFTLLPGHEQSIQSEAYRLADGGGMHADWAILRLYKTVPVAIARGLPVNPRRADPQRLITMAGYSRDAGKGGYGEHLTFDPACRITRQSRALSDSNCTAYKGASGGAVVQLSPAGEAQLCGVISEGDSASLSTFVPVGKFRTAIDHSLR